MVLTYWKAEKLSESLQVRAGVQSSSKQEIALQGAVGAKAGGQETNWKIGNTFSGYRWAEASIHF